MTVRPYTTRPALLEVWRLDEMTRPMEALERALDQESLTWLLTQHPTIAEAIENAVRSGATPEDVKRAVIRHTQRFELAARCEQAARALVGE